MTIHFENAAGLVKTLYFSSVFSPDLKIFPWVQYHNAELQTRFMWFDGPNEPDTKADELRMLPIGASMKFLNMLGEGREIRVDNSVQREDVVLASIQDSRMLVEAVNYDTLRDVNLKITNLQKVFGGHESGPLHVVKYLIDSSHSNHLTNTDYPGGIEKVEDYWIDATGGPIMLKHPGLEKHALVLWEIMDVD
jgi:hypothetical protein